MGGSIEELRVTTGRTGEKHTLVNGTGRVQEEDGWRAIAASCNDDRQSAARPPAPVLVPLVSTLHASHVTKPKAGKDSAGPPNAQGRAYTCENDRGIHVHSRT